jgi:hypothetical protein
MHLQGTSTSAIICTFEGVTKKLTEENDVHANPANIGLASILDHLAKK